jgi:YHS domain-containing protein
MTMETADLPTATDPVCGMTVTIEVARAAGLAADHDGATYYFCGRGCLLDFGEDPGRVLAPDYEPHM